MENAHVRNLQAFRVSLWALPMALLAGCGASAPGPSAAQPSLDAGNTNLVFVVPPDVANDPLGDINPATGNLNSQGLQRSLLMGTYLKRELLQGSYVTAIYALEPMTHPQTAGLYPDLAAIGFIQPFALLNQTTFLGTTANSFPVNAAYAPGDVPAGVAVPDPYVPAAQGLAFNDANGNNAALATAIINAKQPGFHVFSAPWETTRALLAALKAAKGYDLDLPAGYSGPNRVQALSVTPSGSASLATFDSRLAPGSSYPVLPAPVPKASDTLQDFFYCTRTAGVNGATPPANINTNETVYLIRHVEAHPGNTFEDGNYVGAGQWRALALPGALAGALRGQSAPTLVYAIDPAQAFSIPAYGLNDAYVRPALSVLPYAIANGLPCNLAAGFLLGADASSAETAEATMNFFFTHTAGVNLSNQTILLAWEHNHYPPLIRQLINSYGGSVPAPPMAWPSGDYDTIWTVILDGAGNLTVHNALCEGIDSSMLPAAAPSF
jgi:hypothetical protein